jgi:maleamate amidohydrolase
LCGDRLFVHKAEGGRRLAQRAIVGEDRVGQALLVIDLLNDYLDRWAEADRARLIGKTNRLVAEFRARALPVIWVRQEFEPDLSDAFADMRSRAVFVTIKGTPGAQFDAGLNIDASEPVVIKKRYSAFFGTNLDSLLAELGVEGVTLCGINTHACIRMAAIDAYQRDLEVIIARECVGSYDADHAAMSLSYMSGKIATVLDNDEIAARLGG